ncbi:sigma-70 family RNA polymerase sigma factor [Pseudoflavitalea sp. X16]|uniref:sigma-70 family RNA polymerase sigma factor n=1 Tax=Paraflavitalea devenefica TaxID=2716334 RepID=UPI0014241D83|nr:sigma-70 family RNA polymerase sigma factor [Paraflavitalea devenefica]NII27371.1 sigma-70 family RNA polymerase sigma factor [Paraflavitalea devenefica]
MAFSINNKKALTARYEKMYFSTKDRLIGFVQHNVRNPAVADDIVQECYIRLWEKMDKVQDDDTILHLLRKYAHNLIIDYVRKSAREALRENRYQQQQAAVCTADEQLLLKEVLQDYDKAVQALPPRRRIIYRLVKEEGLSHREIADQLQISTNTIEKQMNEALYTLRNHFTPERLSALILVISTLRG